MSTSDIKLDLFREIDRLPPEILLEIKKAVAKISEASSKTEPPRKREFGSMKGLVAYMAPDFNAPLDEFKDYAPE